MEKRRSMSETLTPSEAEFLSSGNPGRARADESKKTNVQVSLQSTVEEGLVTTTFRLTPSLVKLLQRTASERKINRQKPASQQEIVEAALWEWMKANEYL